RKNESLSISDFQWNEEAQEYRCPTGHALRSEWRAFKNQRSHVTKADTIIFRSRQTDCSECSMKERCCPNTSFRKIARSVHEAARNVARRIAATPQYVRSRHERKKVEMLFRSSQTNPETGSIKATRNDRCKRRIYLGRCGTEFKTTGETDLTRAADHGIGTPGISKKPSN
ncbi:Transposase DDE domain-containing protein, partial [Pseudomonas rhodesiae]